VRGDFADVEITRVDILKNPKAMRDLGIRRHPAFACGDQVLSGFFLGKRRIRKFLASL
jgi:hypothetical protein